MPYSCWRCWWLEQLATTSTSKESCEEVSSWHNWQSSYWSFRQPTALNVCTKSCSACKFRKRTFSWAILMLMLLVVGMICDNQHCKYCTALQIVMRDGRPFFVQTASKSHSKPLRHRAGKYLPKAAISKPGADAAKLCPSLNTSTLTWSYAKR